MLEPEFGPMVAEEINEVEWQMWVDQLSREGLSRSRIANHVAVASSIYAWALSPSRRYVTRNPLRIVELPPIDEKPRLRVALAEESERLLTALSPEDRVAYALACYAGLRRAEMPATWRTYGVDADGDGRADPANPTDAIFSAAAYLRASGAPVVTTGTNHSTHTVDGRVSDHTTGHAADLGMAANGGHDDSPIGDRLMTACLTAGGLAAEQAADFARAGGLYILEHDGLRVQCIWKTDEGDNHHDQVHAAARPL